MPNYRHRTRIKEHLLRPCREISVRGEAISEGKGEGTEREQTNGKRVIKNPRHVHEIQTHSQEV